MSAEQALFDAYRKWHRLARAGHRAIAKRDWGLLLECQNVVRGILPSLVNLQQEARNEWKRSKVDSAQKEKKLHAVILELKTLLESNKKLLQVARSTAFVEREKIDRAGRNLKLLQNSYVSPRPCAWTSFS